MTWLLRSAPISFRAKRLRTAWAAGIIFEPGKRAAVTTACRSMRSSKGTNRNRPAKGVRKERGDRSEEHTSELQSRGHLVCRLLLEKKKTTKKQMKQRTRRIRLNKQ